MKSQRREEWVIHIDRARWKAAEGKNEHILYPPVSAIPVGPLSNDFEALELWQPLFSFNIGTKKNGPLFIIYGKAKYFMCELTQSIMVQKFQGWGAG